MKRVDTDLNKLTVIGSVDPSKIRDVIEKRTKKKVEIISPKKDKDKNGGDGNDKKNSGDKEGKNDKKSKDVSIYM